MPKRTEGIAPTRPSVSPTVRSPWSLESFGFVIVPFAIPERTASNDAISTRMATTGTTIDARRAA